MMDDTDDGESLWLWTFRVLAWFFLVCTLVVSVFGGYVLWEAVRNRPVYDAMAKECSRRCKSYTFTPILMRSEFRLMTNDSGECSCVIRTEDVRYTGSVK